MFVLKKKHDQIVNDLKESINFIREDRDSKVQKIEHMSEILKYSCTIERQLKFTSIALFILAIGELIYILI